MKKHFAICYWLALGPLLLFAQNKPNTILWEVSKPGMAFKSYLFGTFHQVNPAFFDSLANANKKLNGASTLFVETESEQSAQPSSPAKLAAYSWSKAKWDSILKPAQKDTFDTYVKKSETDLYYSLSPAALQASLLYAYLQYICDTGPRDSYQPMDFYIAGLGRKNKMRVEALDQDQLQILQDSQEQDSLLSTKRNANSCIGLMAKILQTDTSECGLITTYKNYSLNYEFDKNPAGLKVLLEDRNRKWMEILPKAFEKGPCFVAVGFRHLFYGYGLIESLKRLGYKVEPISTK